MSPSTTRNGKTKPTKKSEKKARKKTATRKLSRLRKPKEMTLDDWQVGLRRQFGVKQEFKLKNIGSEPIFSEFNVTNPQTERTYRVAIRGCGLGENFCSCPDYAVNTLGTCKHIEFVLGRLSRRRGGKTALAAGFQPDYSQVYLQYGAQRRVVFKRGTDCPADFGKYAKRFFDSNGILKRDAAGRFNLFLKRISSIDHEVRCYDDVLCTIAEMRDREWLAESVDKAFPRGSKSAAFKRLLKTQLFPYQREGALFAARAGRSLIADDMGLGKTI
ncbi:MAG: SWIM zinc finger family protein, partial [Pirellulales bacterium]|nr:SWIM zinc finger family protein [Pirellulales bacterium]